MVQRDTTSRRSDDGLEVWHQPGELERSGSTLFSDELFDDPDYHDGWSAIRRRPSPMTRKEV